MSTLITWEESHHVGIMEMDEEHKLLARLVNRLYDEMKHDKEAALYTLDCLIHSTQLHFKHEEILMKEFDYENYSAHKRAHSLLVNEILVFRQKVLSGHDYFNTALMGFLYYWLVPHVEDQDKQLAAFLRQQKFFQHKDHVMLSMGEVDASLSAG